MPPRRGYRPAQRVRRHPTRPSHPKDRSRNAACRRSGGRPRRAVSSWFETRKSARLAEELIEGVRGSRPSESWQNPVMAVTFPFVVDSTDRQLLTELQRDGRQSIAELARTV